MKVVILSPFPPPADGIGSHSAQLARAWARSGEVLVIAPGRDPVSLDRAVLVAGDVASGHETHNQPGRVSVLRALRIGRSRALAELICDFQPDLVFCQFAVSALTDTTFSALSVCRRVSSSGVPVVMAFHEPVREVPRLGPLGPVIYRRAARSATHTLCFASVANRALEDLGITGSALVPLGIEGRSNQTTQAHNDPDEALGSRPPVVLALGFIHQDKGTDVLIQAAESLGSEPGAVHVVVAGKVRRRRGLFRLMGRADERFETELRASAAQSQADIDFHGFVAPGDLDGLLDGTTIAVLPYRDATQSGIATTMLAAGIPVVASDLPGLREQLGSSARYVPPGDPEALAEAVNALLGDPFTRREMRRTALERAQEQSYERVADQIAQMVLGDKTALGVGGAR